MLAATRDFDRFDLDTTGWPRGTSGSPLTNSRSGQRRKTPYSPVESRSAVIALVAASMTLHGASPWYRARPGVTLCSCEHNPPRGEPAVSIPGKSESLKALAPFRFKLRVRSVSATPSIRYRVTHTVPRRTECQRFLLPKQSNQKYSLPNQQAAETAPPEAVLTRIITAGLANQAVYVAAKLGIADLLADGPKILHPSGFILLKG